MNVWNLYSNKTPLPSFTADVTTWLLTINGIHVCDIISPSSAAAEGQHAQG